jgi:hypothetical protein
VNPKRKRILNWMLVVVAGLGVLVITVAFMSSDRAGKISIGFVGYVEGSNGVTYAKFVGTNFNTRPIHYDMRMQRLALPGWPTASRQSGMIDVLDWGPAQPGEDLVWLARTPDEAGPWRIYVRYDTYLGRVDRGRMWLADFLNRHKFVRTARVVWTDRLTSVAYGPEMRK